jgi:hypothetical protein
MSGKVVPIGHEQAKLAQEVLRTVRGFGDFLAKALASTPEDLIAYLGGDWLRVRRAENLARLFEEARQRLADWYVEEPRPAPLSVALPILEGAADEDRDELVELWARLLANAMVPSSRDTVRVWFIDAVKKMDPPDAVVLTHMYKQDVEVVNAGNYPFINATIGLNNIAKNMGRDPDEVEASLRHLVELRFLDMRPDRPSVVGPRQWATNPVSRGFMQACYPEIRKFPWAIG